MTSGPYRIQTRSERSLGWDALPAIGADRRAGRGRVWRRLSVALAGFWLVAACAVALALLA